MPRDDSCFDLALGLSPFVRAGVLGQVQAAPVQGLEAMLNMRCLGFGRRALLPHIGTSPDRCGQAEAHPEVLHLRREGWAGFTVCSVFCSNQEPEAVHVLTWPHLAAHGVLSHGSDPHAATKAD